MSNRKSSQQPHPGKWLTVRVTDDELQRVKESAGMAGLGVSDYVRRKLNGGRPLIAQTGAATIRELRRTGGLLKHNFSVLRETGALAGIFEQQEEPLRLSAKKTAVRGKMPHTPVTTKKTEEICNTKAHKIAWRADGIRVVHRRILKKKTCMPGEIFVGRNAGRTQSRIDCPCGRKNPQQDVRASLNPRSNAALTRPGIIPAPSRELLLTSYFV